MEHSCSLHKWEILPKTRDGISLGAANWLPTGNLKVSQAENGLALVHVRNCFPVPNCYTHSQQRHLVWMPLIRRDSDIGRAF